jgi:NAD-dependent DNA ligase
MPARDVDSENPACGRIFVFTGTLQSMTRAEATAKVIAAGGKCVSSVSDRVHFLVMGEQDLRQLHGETKSRKARSAKELIADGVNIEVIGEKDFLEMLTPEPQGENNDHDHSTERGCRKSR